MKECYYEILGVKRNASADDIKRAWRKKALELHPDKHLDQSEVYRVKFQRAHQAYVILSDRKERVIYDSNRDKILRSDENKEIAEWSNSCTRVEQIQKYMTDSCYSSYKSGRNSFYTVYGKLFERIQMEEICAARIDPESLFDEKYESGYLFQKVHFGDENTQFLPSLEVFYFKFLNFHSIKSFRWYDRYYRNEHLHSRFERRYIISEALKERNEHRIRYTEAIRDLTKFVMSRDPRYKEYSKELQTRKTAEKNKLREKTKELNLRTAPSQSLIEEVEAEWTKVDYSKLDLELAELSIECEKEELYCIACEKGYKSQKSFANHEQSKKHLKMLKQLQKGLLNEENAISFTDVYEEDN